MGYTLSVATTSGAAGSGTQVDIPVAAARAEGGGVLAYDVQMSADRAHYLVMRAYSAQSVSSYSNEIVIPAVTTTATTSTSLAATAAVGETAGGTVSGSTPVSAGGSGSGTMGGSTASSAGTSDGTDGTSSTGATTASAAAMSSLDFDGAGEFLASSAASPLGASSEFSLSVWALSDPQATGSRALVSVRGGSGATQNRVELSSNAADLTVTVTNDAGQLAYSAVFAGVLSPGEWQHLALTFDSAIDSGPMLLVDGLTRAPTSANLTGNAATFSDTSGRVFVGGSGSGGTATWLGAIGHVALFGAALGDDEINEISVRGHTLDLRENAGAYQGSAALLHYWRLGEDPNAVGYDSGSAATPIDLDDASGYIDAADIVADAPVLLP